MLRRSTVFCLLACAFTHAFGIEFISPAASQRWVRVEDVATGCMASEGNGLKVKLWVGDCQGVLPHGIGFIIDQGQLYSGGMNQGREYRRAAASETASIEAYRARAAYLASYTAVLFAPKQTDQAPGTSALSLRAANYLKAYPDAPEAERANVSAALQNNEDSLCDAGYTSAAAATEVYLITQYLQKWGGLLDAGRKKNLTDRVARLDAQAQVSRERAHVADLAAQAEREQLRQRMSKTACSLFYPGYVGKYKGNGWLATADAFVVRYLNAPAKRVTIEGTDSGNSLKYGQYRELSCFELWEGLQ
ncbi:MAG: hypothetical protein Q7U28_01260 [Aquabacterium sp.]|nr:hypothetical protein [Aquabacterium sp.]